MFCFQNIVSQNDSIWVLTSDCNNDRLIDTFKLNIYDGDCFSIDYALSPKFQKEHLAREWYQSTMVMEYSIPPEFLIKRNKACRVTFESNMFAHFSKNELPVSMLWIKDVIDNKKTINDSSQNITSSFELRFIDTAKYYNRGIMMVMSSKEKICEDGGWMRGKFDSDSSWVLSWNEGFYDAKEIRISNDESIIQLECVVLYRKGNQYAVVYVGDARTSSWAIEKRRWQKIISLEVKGDLIYITPMRGAKSIIDFRRGIITY